MKLTFVGDIFPGNLPYNRGCGVAALDFSEIGRESYVSRLQNIVGDTDFLCGNLESPVLQSSSFSVDSQFAGHADFVKLLMESGFNLVSIANNHILEHGPSGLDSTVTLLSESGIGYVGLDRKPFLMEKDRQNLAFISYNAIDNDVYDKYRVSELSLDAVEEDMRSLRQEGADWVFVILHWGDEFISRPSADQIDFAHRLIDSGADFIISTHPHVVQPVERYHNGLICYSLGNFIFDMCIPRITKVGMVLELTLSGGTFTYQEKFVEIRKDCFPFLIKNVSQVRKKLDSQLKMMEESASREYSEKYVREKKKKRLMKRISEKWLLLKNWHKYSPEVRSDFKKYYLSKFGYGKD